MKRVMLIVLSFVTCTSVQGNVYDVNDPKEILKAIVVLHKLHSQGRLLKKNQWTRLCCSGLQAGVYEKAWELHSPLVSHLTYSKNKLTTEINSLSAGERQSVLDACGLLCIVQSERQRGFWDWINCCCCCWPSGLAILSSSFRGYVKLQNQEFRQPFTDLANMVKQSMVKNKELQDEDESVVEEDEILLLNVIEE